MFENKTPSPGSKNSDPLKELLKNQTTLHGKDEFYDPFATEWDDEYIKEPFIKPRDRALQSDQDDARAADIISEHKESLANLDIASMTLAGALPNINLSKFTLAGYLKEHGSNIPAASESETSVTTPEPEKLITTHVVKEGETVTSVAKIYGVSEEAIKKANPDQAMQFEKTDKSGYIWSFRKVGVPIVIPSKEVAPVVEEVAEETTIAPEAVISETAGAAAEKTSMASEENSILEGMVTSGAGAHTSKQDGEHHNDTGLEASERMAARDLELMADHVETFKKVGKKYNIPPALVAAIASRESRGGKALDEKGYGDDGKGFGLMQVDQTSGMSVVKDDAFGEEHIDQAVSVLVEQLRLVTNKHPQWTYAQQLKGAVAAYNVGIDDVDTLAKMDVGTTGDDYSSDVWARARYYAGLKAFDGEGALSTEISKEITIPALTKEESEEGNSIISASVGKPNDASENPKVHTGNINHTADLRLIQDRLLELGLLTQIAYDKEYNAMVVDIPAKLNSKGLEPSTNEASVDTEEVIRKQVFPEQIPMTIEAITTFQREVQPGGTIDGRIDPGGDTIKAFMNTSLTAESVIAKQEKYKKNKAEEERRAKEAAAEKARIDAIRNEPATAENADRIIRPPRSLEGVAVYISDYLIYNPKLVQKVLERLDASSGASKEVAMYLLTISSDTTLMRCDVEMLETLRSMFGKGFLDYEPGVYGTKEEQQQIERLEQLIERTKNLDLKDLAIEAADNKKDERQYRWNWKDKNAGTGVDCSHFIKEVVATAESEDARRLKQDKGYLTPEEINKYSKSFNDENLKEFEDEERGTRRMARYLESYGYYSTSLEDVKEGDIVFIGPGKEKSIGSIGHIVIIIKIEESIYGKKFTFADSGMNGAKYDDDTGKYEGGGRSVRKNQSMDDNGIIWKGTPYQRHFKGVGRVTHFNK